MLVSVVIPVYNCADTLELLYQSLQLQTYQNLEIIFVDNGSTDHSHEVLKKIAQQDRRVTILIEQQRGVSFARKKGWQHARGEYIYFIDGDDYVASHGIETMVEIALKTKADNIIGSYSLYRDEFGLETCITLEKRCKKYEIHDADHMCFHYTPPLWAHLYKRELICENFFVPLNQLEDYLFNWYVYVTARKSVLTSKEVYFYNKQITNGLSSLTYLPTPVNFLKQVSKFLQYCMNLDVLEQYEEDVKKLLNRRFKILERKITEIEENNMMIYTRNELETMKEEIRQILYLLDLKEDVHYVKKR